jgi:hypothetical protein
MDPVQGEVPQIDWPVVQIGDQRLIVRWTFYAQWLLSKRGVNVKELPTLMESRDPTLVNTMVECFAATVAENFTARNLPAPSADHWAAAISHASEQQPALWSEINQKIWVAVGKTRPAAATTQTPNPAQQGMTTQ